ncbi:hypothetical protein ACHHV8_29255 [Paenibacillus sp. TAB 01]|uniref:hypothetical protein n=1 Tax=Paenibacillus sp. TAB 01 TaxID=3368988 RepID=UPI00375184F3
MQTSYFQSNSNEDFRTIDDIIDFYTKAHADEHHSNQGCGNQNKSFAAKGDREEENRSHTAKPLNN